MKKYTMKKILAYVLTACLVAPVISYMGTITKVSAEDSTEPTQSIQVGDTNGDGVIDAVELVRIKKAELPMDQAMKIHMEYQKENPTQVVTKSTYSGGKMVFDAYVPEGITGGTGWWGVAPTTSQDTSIYTISSNNYSLQNTTSTEGKWSEYKVNIPDDGQKYYLAIGGATGTNNNDWAGKQLLIDNVKIYDADDNLVAEDNFNEGFDNGLFLVRETGWDYVACVETTAVELSARPEALALAEKADLNGVDSVDGVDAELMREFLVGERYSFYKADTSAVNNDTSKYQVTDELDRTLSDKGANSSKAVGIRYFLHMGAEESKELYSVSNILAANSLAYGSSELWEAAGGGAVGTKHWWGEPLFGYYTSLDKWVVERDVQMLTDAGIDFLAIDTTDGVYTEQLMLLLEVLDKYYDQGFNVPKVTFTSDVTSSVAELKSTYVHLWYETDTIAAIANMSTVHVAESTGEAMSAGAFYEDSSNHSRSYNGKRIKTDEDAVLYGYNFEFEFEEAMESGADVVLVENWNEWLAERAEGTEAEPIVLNENADIENSSDIQPMDGGYGDDYYMQLVDCIKEFKGNKVTNNKLNTATVTEAVDIDINGELTQWNKVSSYYLDYTDEISDRNAEGYDAVTMNKMASFTINNISTNVSKPSFITKSAYPAGSTITFDYYIEDDGARSWWYLCWTTDSASADIYKAASGLGDTNSSGIALENTSGKWITKTITLPTENAEAEFYFFFAGAATEWSGTNIYIDNVKIETGETVARDKFDAGVNGGLFNTDSTVSLRAVAEPGEKAVAINVDSLSWSTPDFITDSSYPGGSAISFKAYAPERTGDSWWGVIYSKTNTGNVLNEGDGWLLSEPCTSEKVGAWTEFTLKLPDDTNDYYIYFMGNAGTWSGKQLLIDDFTVTSASGELLESEDFNSGLGESAFKASSAIGTVDMPTVYTDTTGRNDISKAKMTSDGENLYALVETVDAIQGFGTKNCMSLFISTGNVGGCWNQYEYVVNRDSSKASDGNVVIEQYVAGAWKKVGTAKYHMDGNVMQLAIPLETIGCSTECDLEFKWADNYSEDDIYSFYTQGDVAPYGRLNYVYQYEEVDRYVAITVDNMDTSDVMNFITANKYPAGSTITFDAFYPTMDIKSNNNYPWWSIMFATDLDNPVFWNTDYNQANADKMGRWSTYSLTIPSDAEEYYVYIVGDMSCWSGNQLYIDNFVITDPSGKVTKETFNHGYGIFNVKETNSSNATAVELKEKATEEITNQSAELHFVNFDGANGAWDFITTNVYPKDYRIVFDAYIPSGNSGSWWGALTTATPSDTSIYNCAGANSLSLATTDQWITFERATTEDGQYFAIGGPQSEFTDRNVFVDNFKIYNADGDLIAKDDFSNGLHNGIFDIDETGNETNKTTVSLGTPTGGTAIAGTYQNGALAVSTATDRTTHMSYGKYPAGSVVTFDAYVPTGLEWWGVDAIEDKNDIYVYSTEPYGGNTQVYNQNPYYYGEWASYTWTLNADGYIAFEANWNDCGNLLIDNVVVTSPEGKVLVRDDFDNCTINDSMFDILNSDKAYLVERETEEAAVLFTAYDSPTINGSTSGDNYAIIDEAYGKIAEAGFNKLLPLREGYTSVAEASDQSTDLLMQVQWRSSILEEAIETSLELAEKHGLKYYVKDWSFYNLGSTNSGGDAAVLGSSVVNTETQFKEIIEDMFDSTNPYIGHASYAGNYAVDEPGDNDTDFQALKYQAMYYNQMMSDKQGELYVNLLPAYGDQDDRNSFEKWLDDLQNETFDKYSGTYVSSYLKKYLDVATASDSKIDYIAWDYYPFMESDNENKTLREQNYLFNFKAMADAASENALDLRMTLQSSKESGYGLRDVNAADLRFQIYTGMAFGVTDFTYYKYSGANGEGIFDYTNGETNTTLYNHAKEVNNEVHAIEDWFADYKWISIMAKQGTNTTTMSDNMIDGMQLSNSDSIAHENIHSVTATQDTIAGIFTAKDTTATTRPYGYMFVNMADPANNSSDAVTINFADGVKGVLVCIDGKQSIVSVSGSYTFELGAGAGAFIVPISG